MSEWRHKKAEQRLRTLGRAALAMLCLLPFLLFFLLCATSPAHASSGRGTVYQVVSNGGSPATYTLTVNSSADITVGDHLLAYTTSTSGVWLVTAKPSATTVTVQDSLTEANGDVAFGAPSATGPRNVFAYATPAANGLTLIPDASLAYASAALRRNANQTGTGGGSTHNVLSATHSDTTAGTVVRGDVMTGQGATPKWVRLPIGASGRFMRSDGTDAAWTAIQTGDLPTVPVTAGGTNATTASGARTNLGLAIGTDVQAYHALLAAIAGTTPTKGKVFVCDGTTIQALTVGTNGQVLTADSAQATGLTWSSAGGGGTHQLLSATHPDTTTGTVQRGDLITGQGASATWSRLAKGSSGTYLRSDGTDLSYSGLDMGDATAGTLAVGRGGTGGATTSAARTALGLAIGTDVQAFDADLAALAALAHTAGYTIVSVGGAWVAAAPEFFDDLLAIKDNADPTKRAVFQASGINTGTTRTFTLPNQSGTIALLTDITATGSFLDTVFDLHDEADATKIAMFQTSGITTGTTRTFTLPDATGTLALTADLSAYVPTGRTITTTAPLLIDGGSSASLATNRTIGMGTQSANRVLAGPTGGGAAAPDFRALVAADVPDLSGTYQPLDAQLTDVAAVSPTLDRFLGGDGSNLVMRTTAQVKTSLAIDHGADVTGLGDDDHTQYALLAGRSGGQALVGGTGANDGLTIRGSSNATPGTVSVGRSSVGGGYGLVVDEDSNGGYAGVAIQKGTTGTPTAGLHMFYDLAVTGSVVDVVKLDGQYVAGSPSAGLGLGTLYQLEDASGNTGNNAARTSVVWTDATNGAEAADFVVEQAVAGSLTERLRVTSQGALVLAEVSAPSTPASAKAAIYVKSDGRLYSKDDAGAETAYGDGDVTAVTAGDGLTGGATSGAASLAVGAGTGITVDADSVSLAAAYVNPAQCGGRLSASSTAPVTTADTTSATLYFLPYQGNRVPLYNGTRWVPFELGPSGISLSVASLTIDQNYDIFVYDSSGLTLEAVAWGSHAAGSSERYGPNAPTLQDGVWVRTSATSKRYLGTIRTVSSTGTKVRDAIHYRFIWNAQNRIQAVDYDDETTDNWTTSGVNGTFAAINGGSAVWKYEFVLGMPDIVVSARATVAGVINATGYPTMGIALNSTTALDKTKSTMFGNFNIAAITGSVEFTSPAPVGYGYVQGIESSSSADAARFYGDNAGAVLQSGMFYVGDH